MICEYDYTCPHCGRTDNVSSSNQAPNVGDVEICRFCNKGGKIVYAKVIYEIKKVNPSGNELNGSATTVVEDLIPKGQLLSQLNRKGEALKEESEEFPENDGGKK